MVTNLQTTEREAQLQQELKDLQTEQDSAKEENAKMWAALSGRAT